MKDIKSGATPGPVSYIDLLNLYYKAGSPPILKSREKLRSIQWYLIFKAFFSNIWISFHWFIIELVNQLECCCSLPQWTVYKGWNASCDNTSFLSPAVVPPDADYLIEFMIHIQDPYVVMSLKQSLDNSDVLASVWMLENILRIDVAVWGLWLHIEKLPSDDVYPDVWILSDNVCLLGRSLEKASVCTRALLGTQTDHLTPTNTILHCKL